MTEDVLMQQVAAKKAALDRLRQQLPHALDNLNHSYGIELTYSSNAIEGNTLTAAETMLVIVARHHGWR
jgi:Fic family protein